MKARVKFKRIKNIVVMEVLEMDERFRSNYEGGKSFAASNGIKILSIYVPEFDRETVYLRGVARAEDYSNCRRVFKNEETAYDFIQKAKAALLEWGQNWEGFKDDKLVTVDSSASHVEVVEVV